MKLEVGKKYVDQAGKIVEIEGVLYQDNCGIQYTENGTRYTNSYPNNYSLVKEYIPQVIDKLGKYRVKYTYVTIIHLFEDIACGFFYGDKEVYNFDRRTGKFIPDARCTADYEQFNIIKHIGE